MSTYARIGNLSHGLCRIISEVRTAKSQISLTQVSTVVIDLGGYFIILGNTFSFSA